MTRIFLVCALAWLPGASWGQEAWLPALPVLARPAPTAASIGATPLDSLTTKMGFALIVSRNAGGFGAETARVSAWSQGKDGLALRRGVGGWRLVSASGEGFSLSEGFGAALDHMNQFYRLASAAITASSPTYGELQAAFLSEAGVARVAELFEETIRERLEFDGQVLLPEIGGESTLDGGFDFHENPDRRRPVLRQIARFRDDPEELRRIYRENPEDMSQLDEINSIKNLLNLWPELVRRNSVPRQTMEKNLKGVVDSVLENSAHAYFQDTDDQAALAMRDQWSGRYAGLWHVHPPDYNVRKWETSTPPSKDDMEIARKVGQNLTIVFQPDGFDAYDLSPLFEAPTNDPALIKKISYRSERWREHFQELHDRLYPKR